MQWVSLVLFGQIKVDGVRNMLLNRLGHATACQKLRGKMKERKGGGGGRGGGCGSIDESSDSPMLPC